MGPRRNERRISSGRLFLFLVVITISIILINSAVSGAKHGPGQQVIALSFLDELRPLIDDSNSQATALQTIRGDLARKPNASSAALSSAQVQTVLTSFVRETQHTRDQAYAASPPSSLRDAHSLFTASLVLRAQAAASIKTVLTATTSNAAVPASTLNGISNAINASDEDFAQFMALVPSDWLVKAKLPNSQWGTSNGSWTPADLTALSQSWKSNVNSSVINDMALLSVSTSPSEVREIATGNVVIQVIPPQGNMTVTVIVGNVGNVSEQKVLVRVVITAADGTSDSRNAFVTLDPGGRATVTLSNLRVKPAGVSTVSATVSPVAGETNTNNNTRTFQFEMNPTAHS